MNGSAEAVAQAFAKAISQQDVNTLVELMTENHRFIDSLRDVVEGSEKMRAGWAGYFQMVPDYTITIAETYSTGPAVVMIGSAQGTYCSDGVLSHDRIKANHWQTPAAFRAIIEDGKVAEWRVYADNEPIRKLMTAQR